MGESVCRMGEIAHRLGGIACNWWEIVCSWWETVRKWTRARAGRTTVDDYYTSGRRIIIVNGSVAYRLTVLSLWGQKSLNGPESTHSPSYVLQTRTTSFFARKLALIVSCRLVSRPKLTPQVLIDYAVSRVIFLMRFAAGGGRWWLVAVVAAVVVVLVVVVVAVGGGGWG